VGNEEMVAMLQVCAVMEFQSQQACTAAAIVSRGTSPCCATGYEGGCLRLFDLATASLAWTAQCHSPATSILAVEVSPSGKELLTAARSGSIIVRLALLKMKMICINRIGGKVCRAAQEHNAFQLLQTSLTAAGN